MIDDVNAQRSLLGYMDKFGCNIDDVNAQRSLLGYMDKFGCNIL